jgi:hypothetical protein
MLHPGGQAQDTGPGCGRGRKPGSGLEVWARCCRRCREVLVGSARVGDPSEPLAHPESGPIPDIPGRDPDLCRGVAGPVQHARIARAALSTTSAGGTVRLGSAFPASRPHWQAQRARQRPALGARPGPGPGPCARGAEGATEARGWHHGPAQNRRDEEIPPPPPCFHHPHPPHARTRIIGGGVG